MTDTNEEVDAYIESYDKLRNEASAIARTPQKIQSLLDRAAELIYGYDKHESIEKAVGYFNNVEDNVRSAFVTAAISDFVERRRYSDSKPEGSSEWVVDDAKEEASSKLRRIDRRNIDKLRAGFARRFFVDHYAQLIADTKESTFTFPYYSDYAPLSDQGIYTDILPTSLDDEISNSAGYNYQLFLEAAQAVNSDYESIRDGIRSGEVISLSDVVRIWNSYTESHKTGKEPLNLQYADEDVHDLLSGFIYDVYDPTNLDHELDQAVSDGYLVRFTENTLEHTANKYRLLVTLCSMGAGSRVFEVLRGDETKTVTAMVQSPLSRRTNDHSLAAGGLDEVLRDFAWWMDDQEPIHTIRPKTKGSNEFYNLRIGFGDLKACSDYLATPGATPALFITIYQTVISIINDPDSADFIDDDGMLNVTASHIIQETRRTLGGSVRGRNDEAGRDIANNAMRVLSRMFIDEGLNSKGKPVKSSYFLVAPYEEYVTYKGNVYSDVWKIDPKYKGLFDIALESDRTWRYQLPAANGPITLEEASIRDQVNRMMSELRYKLYKGRKTPNRRPQYIQRKWQGIFDKHTQQGKQLDSRQKKHLISEYDRILKEVAAQEGKGKINAEKPMSITAETLAKPSRGRSGKVPDILRIEATGSFHKPRVNLTNY